jgi:serine/threonine protein kinase/tetratricopeptide (TPR) repeat protein
MASGLPACLMPMIGESLGNFKLLREIGSGAMGTVYVAEHAVTERKFAVKFLRPDLATNAELVERFFDEARAASKITYPGSEKRHLGIVEIFDCGRHPSGTPFIVMEFLEGESLAAALRRARSFSGELSVVTTIGAQIANAMDAAHARGIVHRDLKPDNIFLTTAIGHLHVVKILDFGIAKLSSQLSTSRTQLGTVMGTPLYMSPEQWRGDSVTAAADIYSLGCILFEMAWGKPPFSKDNVEALKAAHLTQVPLSLSKLEPLIPVDLDALVSQMLGKLPRDRPVSMEEVETRLEEIGAASMKDRAQQPLPHETVPYSPRCAKAVVPTQPFIEKAGTPAVPPSLDAAETKPERPSQESRPTLKKRLLRWIIPAALKRLPRWIIPAALAALVLAAGAIFLIAQERAAAAAARARLDTLLGAAGDPAPPTSCQVRDKQRLRALLRPAELLTGSRAGAARPSDVEALALLDKDAGPRMSAVAEYWTLLARARLAVKQNDPVAALDAARAAVRLCPGYAVPEYLAGTISQRGGRLQEARTDYERAAAASATYVAPRLALGMLAMQAKDYERAESLFDEVLGLDRDEYRARIGRGQARLQKGDVKGALLDLREVTSRRPDIPEGWLLLGRALAKDDQWEEALSAFCTAKRLGSPEAEKYCDGK